MWRALSPWRAIADGRSGCWSGRDARPDRFSTGRVGGEVPGAGPASFVAPELRIRVRVPADALAIATALYSYWALLGWRSTGARRGPATGGLAVAFELLSRIAPFAVRDGKIVVRWPFTGLGGDERVRGTPIFVAVLLGSTSFDGFSRTSMWQNLIGNIRADLADSPQRTVDLATTLTNVSGLALFVLGVASTYLVAVLAARALTGAGRSLVPDFVLPLVPIAAAYLVAHYFSLFLIQGQFIITLVSDPSAVGGTGSGPSTARPTAIVSPTRCGTSRSGRRRGHVAGLAIAHDRAVNIFEDRRAALRSQYDARADGAPR